MLYRSAATTEPVALFQLMLMLRHRLASPRPHIGLRPTLHPATAVPQVTDTQLLPTQDVMQRLGTHNYASPSYSFLSFFVPCLPRNAVTTRRQRSLLLQDDIGLARVVEATQSREERAPMSLRAEGGRAAASSKRLAVGVLMLPLVRLLTLWMSASVSVSVSALVFMFVFVYVVVVMFVLVLVLVIVSVSVSVLLSLK